MSDVSVRDEKLDLLTVLACFLVVLYHECGNYSDVVLRAGNMFCELYCLIAEVAVPLFVMKSGALFLNPDKRATFPQMAKKCLKLLCVIMLWGMVYNLISNATISGFSWETLIVSIESVVKADTRFNYQFWYLYMQLGLYAAVPVIKKFTDTASKKELLWCIAFLTVEGCLVPFICRIIGIDAEGFWGTRFIGVYGEYLLYFILGTYLYRYSLTKNTRIILILMLVVATVFCAGEVLSGSDEQIWMTYLSPFTVLYATVAFDSIMRAHVSEKVTKHKYLARMADSCFGIYILHVMVIVAVRKVVGIDCSWAAAVISVPIMTVLTWGLCFFIVQSVNKVPALRRFALW